jgi:hypothetical protein
MSPTQGAWEGGISEKAKIFVDYHLLDLCTVCEDGFVCWSVYGDFRLHYRNFRWTVHVRWKQLHANRSHGTGRTMPNVLSSDTANGDTDGSRILQRWFFSCLDVPEPCQPSQEASFSLGFNGEFIATLTKNVRQVLCTGNPSRVHPDDSGDSHETLDRKNCGKVVATILTSLPKLTALTILSRFP